MTRQGWACIIASLALCGSARAELLMNGGFEAGGFVPNADMVMSLQAGDKTMTGWEVIAGSVSWIGVGDPFGLDAADGSLFLDLTDYRDSPPYGGVRQTMATVPGHEYAVSLYLGSSTRHGAAAAVTVSAGGTVETLTSPTPTTANEWTARSLKFKASETSTTVSIVGTTGLHYIGLDAVSVEDLTAGVVVAGREWRQLTDTTYVTWNEVAAVCPVDGNTPCNGSIHRSQDGDLIGVTGWTWARNLDVQALFESIIQPDKVNFTSEFASYSLVSDPDIERALSGAPGGFEPTRTDAAGRYLYGLTATSGSDVGLGYRPGVRDAIPGNTDWVNLGTTLSNTGRQSYTGAWLFRSVGGALDLKSLTLKSSEVAGCKSVTGTVTLTGPAPAEGVAINLSDTLNSASTPATLKILSGVTSKTFTVKTTAASASENGTVSATVGSTTLSQPLTVRPMGLTSVTLTPTSVVGGQPVTGKATLECKAGPGPITVNLSSTDPAVASPVAASIVVPQAMQSTTFAVTTNAVQAKSYATISGAANGITKLKKLTVNVAAAASPTSLKFGSVTVGATGGPQNVTFMNKGAVAFSVNSISLTGTYASWFLQSHNCLASLPAGASCTIAVTFKPLAAASKSAKLSIATSATSMPLSLALSGTGI